MHIVTKLYFKKYKIGANINAPRRKSYCIKFFLFQPKW